jgi:hypothetical protein
MMDAFADRVYAGLDYLHYMFILATSSAQTVLVVWKEDGCAQPVLLWLLCNAESEAYDEDIQESRRH